MKTLDRFDKSTWPDDFQDVWIFDYGNSPLNVDRDELIRLAEVNARDYQYLPCDDNGWIRVEDGLPPDDGKYIVHSTESYRDFWGSSWDATLQEWVHDMSHSPDPTHWQPAPQPPTKEGDNG